MNNSASFKLAPLSPEDALFLAHVFERLRDAIWQAHGDAMADHIQTVNEQQQDLDLQEKPWIEKPDPDF